MKRKLEVSELIFKIISYTLLTVFALACLYPFIYAISAAISGEHEVEYNEIILLPKNIQFDALRAIVLAPTTRSMPMTLFIISAAEAIPLDAPSKP